MRKFFTIICSVLLTCSLLNAQGIGGKAGIGGTSGGGGGVGGGAFTDPTIIQTKNGNSTSSQTTVSLTFASPVTSGNSIVLACLGAQGSANPILSSATDDKGNSYTVDVTKINIPTGSTANLAHFKNATNSPSTVTATFAAATFGFCVGYEVHPNSNTMTVDVTNSATDGGGANPHTFNGAAITQGTRGIAFSVMGHNIACANCAISTSNMTLTGTCETTTTPGTSSCNNSGGNFASGAAAYSITSAAVTVTPSWTLSNNNNEEATVIGSFK